MSSNVFERLRYMKLSRLAVKSADYAWSSYQNVNMKP